MILVLAADFREIKELCAIKLLERSPLGIQGILSGKKTRFVANGPGMENARVAVTEVCRAETPSAIVSVGYVGALDPTLDVGQVFVARQVTRLDSAVKYSVETPLFAGTEGVAEGTLVTIDRVAQTQGEKRVLRESGADAVDMEAYAVAEEADRRSVPFYCVRVVSDRADTDFAVDFNRARKPDGTFSGWGVVAQAGFRPHRWKQLLGLKRDADLASKRLAEFLSSCRFDAN